MHHLCWVLFATSTVTLAYPTGAPQGACKDMVPGHPPTTTSGTPPYAINISSTVYSPGSVINGVLYSTPGVIFRGFLLQARSLNDPTSDTIGVFVGDTILTHNECGQGSKRGLTHSNSQNKSSLEFTWTAPDTDHGDIRFRVTVVESYDPSEYWLNIYSGTIKSSSSSILPTESPLTGTNTAQMMTSSVEMTTESTPVTTKVPATVHNDPACGKTKGCFPNCKDKSCDFLITWQHDRNSALASASMETVTFGLQMKVKDVTNVWVAIGLSPEGKMDKTNVAACLSEASGISVQSSYNHAYSNVVFQDTSLGLTFLNGSVSDGVFRCMFQRKRVQNQSHYYDLSDTYFLLAGTGPIQSGIVSQHIETPKKSADRIDFLAAGISREDTTATTLVKLHASLMTVAWVFLSSVGVVVARHCKNILPHTRLLDLKVWFHVSNVFLKR